MRRDYTYDRLAETLLAARIAADKSMRNVQRATGIAVSTLIRLEKGRALPYAKTIKSLSVAYGIPVPELTSIVQSEKKKALAFKKIKK